jgi:hypothetical protein
MLDTRNQTLLRDQHTVLIEDVLDNITHDELVAVTLRALDSDTMTERRAMDLTGGDRLVRRKILRAAMSKNDPYSAFVFLRDAGLDMDAPNVRRLLRSITGTDDDVPREGMRHPRRQVAGNSAVDDPGLERNLRSSCGELYKTAHLHRKAVDELVSLRGASDLQNAALLVSCLLADPSLLTRELVREYEGIGDVKDAIRTRDGVKERMRLYRRLRMSDENKAYNSHRSLQKPYLPMLFKATGHIRGASCADTAIEEWTDERSVMLDGSHFSIEESPFTPTESFYLLAFSTVFRHIQYGQLHGTSKAKIEAIRARVCPIYKKSMRVAFPDHRRRKLAHSFALARCPPNSE